MTKVKHMSRKIVQKTKMYITTCMKLWHTGVDSRFIPRSLAWTSELWCDFWSTLSYKVGARFAQSMPVTVWGQVPQWNAGCFLGYEICCTVTCVNYHCCDSIHVQSEPSWQPVQYINQPGYSHFVSGLNFSFYFMLLPQPPANMGSYVLQLLFFWFYIARSLFCVLVSPDTFTHCVYIYIIIYKTFN